MNFSSLLDDEELVPQKTAKAPTKRKASTTSKVVAQKDKPKGCDACPLNSVKGVQKIMGTVQGKKIFVIAQSPDLDDNSSGIILDGAPGDILWAELQDLGIERDDCDIQTVVRCLPCTAIEGSYDVELKPRPPHKSEIHCCSIYNEPAKQQSKADAYLILGKIAQESWLAEEYDYTKKIFYSEKLGVKVFCADSPASFLYSKDAARMETFRKTLRALAEYTGFLTPSDAAVMPASSVSDTRAYSYIYQQDYKGVFNGTDAQRIATKLVDWSAKTGSYLSIDIEDYVTDEGEHLILCGGVSDRPGRARVFVLDHPSQKDRPKEERDEVLKWFLYLCSHAKVHITMHYGCSDKYKLALAYGVEMPGFDFDTLLAEFFAYPDRKSFGLSGIAEARYPEFAGYKTMILPHILKPEAYDVKVCQSMLAKKDMNALYKWIFKTGMFSFSLIPIDVLIAYNGADCDLALRVYKDTYDKISLPLMKIYVLMSFLLYEMEPNGPLVDSDYSAKIEKLYTYKFGKAKERLLELAEDPNFNPASPVQLMKVMYDKLEIPYPFNGKPNTQKATLEALQAKYEFPRLIIGFRKLSKALSTYIVGYRKCAAVNRGRLRTKWWLTGTATGRLSSGGGKDGDEGITNLQNIHGDKHIQNIIVAETEWRDTYRLIDSHLKKCDIKMSEYDALVKRTKSDDANEVLIAKDDLKKWLDGKAALLKPIEAELGEYHMFLEFDEAQVEVRVMAMLSGDENLIADCLSGDIHSTVGHAMTGWPVERIKKDKKTRTITKNLHFGLLFGLSAKGLLAFILAKDNTSKISLEDVERYVANYFKRYPKVKLFVENQRAFALEHGYVQTLFGFRRTLNTEELSEDEKEAAAAAGFNGDFGSSGYWGNVAINMPVQGTAHQLMIAALSNLITQREKYAVLGVPQMEVHDAVIWRIKIKHLAECYPLGRYLLEKEGLNTIKEYFPDIEWLVPLEVDCKGGIRYGTKVDIPTPDPLQFCFDWFLVCRSQIRELALDMRVLDQDKGV